jgi:hypothetical protein
MKREEQIAYEFLTKCFGEEPRYEPLGKSTAPDFAIASTAFEVRRLNQRYFNEDGSNEPLEDADFRLNRAVRETLAKTPFTNEGGSFRWGLKFKRPLKDEPGKIAKRLADVARDYYRQGCRKQLDVASDGVTLDLIPVDVVNGRAFLSGYDFDGDSGGMLGDIYPVSIRLALEGKISKTKTIANKFDRWILVLIDDIFGLTNTEEIGPIDLKLEHFNGVVVLNQDGSVALEWPEGSLKR